MSRIERIVELIDALIGANFSVQTQKYWGIAHLEQRDGLTIPVSYKGAGDLENISFDDKYALATYHRIISEDEARDSNLGFGSNLQVSQTYNIRLVVFCNMRNFSDNGADLTYSLKDDIASLIPSKLTSAQLTTLQAQSCLINISGKDLDKRRVFNEEMDGSEFKIEPSHVLFVINYTIRLTYLESCRGTTTSCDDIPVL